MGRRSSYKGDTGAVQPNERGYEAAAPSKSK